MERSVREWSNIEKKSGRDRGSERRDVKYHYSGHSAADSRPRTCAVGSFLMAVTMLVSPAPSPLVMNVCLI
jgi:hypothetical protein